MTAFSTLNVLPEAQLTNLNELGYLTMTPVQAAALPAILEGRDVRVQAKTGSGKTAAFGLGLLQHIDATLFPDPVPDTLPDARAGRPGRG